MEAGLGARLPGRQHAGQNCQILIHEVRSAYPVQEVQSVTVTATAEQGGGEWV